MLFGCQAGALEIRRAGRGMSLRGRFPYGRAATLSDGGRNGKPRKEVIAPRAFSYRIDTLSADGEPKEIHLLAGHDYNRPLASVRAGSLKLKDGDDAVTFTAEIADDLADVTYVRDSLAALDAGLIAGISPGFRIPPARTVPDAESVAAENPAEGQAIIRTVKAALLYEFSLVTRPAYPETQIDARNWTPDAPASDPVARRLQGAAWRWR